MATITGPSEAPRLSSCPAHWGGPLRRLFLIILLVIVSVGIAGCASTTGPEPVPVETATLAPRPLPSVLASPTVAPPAPPPPPRLVPPTPVPPRATPAPAGWKPEFTGGPRLKVSSESEDAGTLVFEEQVLAGFLLTNVGDATLTMTIPLAIRLVEGC